ncbi:MAG TPA: PIG-L family deacetylase [Opitutaceae bacterium]|nr:PIG-L family deacetylase [Opitutaceae bacterium]
MNFFRPDADVFVPPPASLSASQALARTTHLCVAAHQDDIEIMAHAGIVACHARADKFFTGVVVTNGAGSPRSGRYAEFTDAQMQAVRREEQRRAAALGRYNLQLQLAHPSGDVKTPAHAGVRTDLETIFRGCTPEVVYLHNPADKHDTHVAVLLRCIEALRALPQGKRPRRVLGCEVWRDLDWLTDADKVALDASAHAELSGPLLQVFDSQIAGGKRYDLATLGRRAANATFHTSHATDGSTAITWAMDLTPLTENPALNIRDFTLAHIDRLRADVEKRLKQFGGQ